MTAIKKKTVTKYGKALAASKKVEYKLGLVDKKAPIKKVAAKKLDVKKVPAKKATSKKVSVKKTEPKMIPAKKWDEGGVDIIKKTRNRLNKPYSVNIESTSGLMTNFPFGDNKTLVEPKKEINKSKLQKFIEKAEKIMIKRYRNEPILPSNYKALVKEEVDRLIDTYKTRKTIDEVLNERFNKSPSGKRKIKNVDIPDLHEVFNNPFKLKSNGKYNVGTMKGLKIINKDGYVPLEVLILKFDKDEIKLLKNGLPIKFILEK
jgi:hypothetical protein